MSSYQVTRPAAVGNIRHPVDDETQFVVVERAWLAKLKQLATRLYSKKRMNGDEMRDAGHLLTGLVRSAISLPDEGILPTAAEACAMHGLTRTSYDDSDV
jgi:hypothetical protein